MDCIGLFLPMFDDYGSHVPIGDVFLTTIVVLITLMSPIYALGYGYGIEDKWEEPWFVKKIYLSLWSSLSVLLFFHYLSVAY